MDTFNLLQERAYMALLITMSEQGHTNQWHKQILEEVDNAPSSEKLWPVKAKIEPCIGHEYNDDMSIDYE